MITIVFLKRKVYKSPYFKFNRMELNKIHNIDCMEGLKQLDDNYVDITITSPPYNVGNNIRGDFYDEHNDDMSDDEYYEFIKNNILECIRVSKKYVFYNFQITSNNRKVYHKLMWELREYEKERIIWHKSIVQPSIDKTVLNSSFEYVIVYTKPEFAKKMSFEFANTDNFNNRKKGAELNNNVIYGKNAATEKFTGRNENKAIFPEYFVEWFIRRFTYEDEIVFDPFMGLGTTAFVAKKMDRKYIGFELSEKYCEIANNRLKCMPDRKNKLDNWF